jgi:hypothetical protein
MVFGGIGAKSQCGGFCATVFRWIWRESEDSAKLTVRVPKKLVYVEYGKKIVMP